MKKDSQILLREFLKEIADSKVKWVESYEGKSFSVNIFSRRLPRKTIFYVLLTDLELQKTIEIISFAQEI